jgi:hypothetical protein
MEKTFAELFCRHRRLPPGKYREVMLRRCLYRRTLMFRRLLAFFSHGYFAADYDLISAVGLLREPEALHDEINTFLDHPANRGFLRRVLRLRVSTRRVRHLFNTLMPCAASLRRNDASGDSRLQAN